MVLKQVLFCLQLLREMEKGLDPVGNAMLKYYPQESAGKTLRQLIEWTYLLRGKVRHRKGSPRSNSSFFNFRGQWYEIERNVSGDNNQAYVNLTQQS